MIQNNIDNNSVIILGKIDSEIKFNHKVYSEEFCSFTLRVQRLSDSFDLIPIMVSSRLITDLGLKEDDYIEIEGQFRSYNNYTNEGNKLILTVFARSIKKTEELDKIKNPNHVFLNGYVCKKPIYRTTPFGREIADILLAVNRPYNKSDYIPCIAWGRNARFSDTLKIGDNIKIWGRIQSRDYQKKLVSGELTTKTAYEVSISKLESTVKRLEE